LDPRERGSIHLVIANSVSDEAIHEILISEILDCFACARSDGLRPLDLTYQL